MELLVSIGVIYKWIEGKPHVFMQFRDEDGALKGKLEFPGGKIEAKELPLDACIREIKEETKAIVTKENSYQFQIKKHTYTHRKVRLFVYLFKDKCNLKDWYNVLDYKSYIDKLPEANLDIFENLINFFGTDESLFKELEHKLWS